MIKHTLALVVAITSIAACSDSSTETALPVFERQDCISIQGYAAEEGTVPLQVDVFAEGLDTPWGLAILPSGDMLVTERPGRLRIIQDGSLVATPVLTVEVSNPPPLFGVDLLGFEGGLLGVTLHPEFESNRLFYLFYNIDKVEGEEISRIARFTLSADGLSATLDRVILDDLPAGLHHQGGRMHIGPDGLLYVGIGAFEPEEAQNPESLAGKLLRMDLEGGIPANNPTPGSYIYVSGIRNSQGFDWFDERFILMVEHGPSGFELDMPNLRGFDEFNVVEAGDNLGWPEIWGCDTAPGLKTPIISWQDSLPPSGAHYYRGERIPEWTNSFLFTVLGFAAPGQHLHRIVLDAINPYLMQHHEVYLEEDYGRLRTVVSGADGFIYVMTSNCDNRGVCPAEGDKILRIGPQ